MRKIIVKLAGGLGNQMFEYAAAHFLAKSLQVFEIVFDTSFLLSRMAGVTPRNFDLDIFNLNRNTAAPISKAGYLHLNDGNFNPSTLTVIDKIKENSKDIYLDGYFQHHQFAQKDLLNIFKLNGVDYDLDFSQLMINIRRADYVSNRSAFNFHGFLGQQYVNAALKKLDKTISKCYIFSDEPKWCIDNLKIQDIEVVYVDHDKAGPKFSNYLYLMSKFQNMIIPNSTFAWWAAWLSENNGSAKQIIAPAKDLWFMNSSEKAQNLYPSNWTLISRDSL